MPEDDDWWRDSADESMDAHPWLLSATDLLVAWAPDELGGGGVAPEQARRAWDRYFEPPPQIAAQEPANERWDSDAAEDVVDCLYRFVHAIERCDIAEAMDCIAPDYHQLEHDVEI